MTENKNYSQYLEYAKEIEGELDEGRYDFAMMDEVRTQLEEEIKAQQAIIDSPDTTPVAKKDANIILSLLKNRFEKNERILDALARDQSEREQKLRALRHIDKTTKEILDYPASEEIN